MDSTPILVGVGQVTEKGVDPAQAMDPVAMMAEAAGRAAEDAGMARKRLADIDLLVAVKSVIDVLEVDGIQNAIENPPEALAARIGAGNTKRYLTATGGNTPQMLVNQIAQHISQGKVGTALLTGAETLDAMARSIKAGLNRNWHIPGNGKPLLWSPERDGSNDLETRHGLYLPAHAYPLFENALRHHYGRSIEAHQQYLGRLFSRFTEVAEKNPFAWFRSRRSPEAIATPSEGNRYIAFPYTKLMNAMIKVNQSAALILTSVDNARRMGINPSRWIYLNGCAEATDHWHVCHRINYYASPAIAMAGKKALAMARCTIDDIAFFDLYSCFPSAVQIARDMLGIEEDDPRPLTVTGGLPYHGGPGNNYTTHAIAEMVQKLRNHPGKMGLVTANGWYITKHAVGIYSSRPNPEPWQRENPEDYQNALDAQPHPEVAEPPSGKGQIETYTVVYDRDGTPGAGIVIGRLEDRRRFIAVTPPDRQLLEALTTNDPIGIWGSVRQKDRLNLFSPE